VEFQLVTIPHQASESVVIDAKELQKLLNQGQESALVYLTLEDQKLQIPVLFDEIQKMVCLVKSFMWLLKKFR
jgi:ribosomal protein L25 (general stress protein Ctc)